MSNVDWKVLGGFVADCEFGRVIFREPGCYLVQRADGEKREFDNQPDAVAWVEELAPKVPPDWQSVATLLADALMLVVKWQGVDCDDNGCPGDHTCECPRPAQVNAALASFHTAKGE